MNFFDIVEAWIKQQSDEAEKRLQEIEDKYEGYSLEDICNMAGDEMNLWNPSDEECENYHWFISAWKYGDWSPGFWTDPSPGSLLKDMSYVLSAVTWNVYNLYEFAQSRGKVKLEPIRYLVTEVKQLTDKIYMEV